MSPMRHWCADKPDAACVALKAGMARVAPKSGCDQPVGHNPAPKCIPGNTKSCASTRWRAIAGAMSRWAASRGMTGWALTPADEDNDAMALRIFRTCPAEDRLH
jgi:hypothetical protein